LTPGPTYFGSGWISGVLSVTLGAIGLGTVLCFHFPSLLTMPELRAVYPLPYIRALLHLVLVGAFVLGTISVCLRYNKALGVSGIGLTLVAALLGGSRVPVGGELATGPFLGLDWFLLNVMVYSLVFIPIERLFARLETDGVRTSRTSSSARSSCSSRRCSR
jgi:lathosterol oxidase